MSKPYRPLKPAVPNVEPYPAKEREISDDTPIWVVGDSGMPFRSTVAEFHSHLERSCDWVEYPVTYSIVKNPIAYLNQMIESLNKQIQEYQALIADIKESES